MNFPRVICDRWYHENVVLMGDAAATGHFSIGSGTRLALDSAIALADYLHSEATLEAAFQRYQDERRVEVLRLQSAARNSLEWFEEVERYFDLHPIQFTYSLLTRSQRISHENLRLRDPDWVRRAEDWFQQQAGGQPGRAPILPPSACATWSCRTASSYRPWRNTRRMTAVRPTGIWSITANAPRAARGWSIPR